MAGHSVQLPRDPLLIDSLSLRRVRGEGLKLMRASLSEWRLNANAAS